MRLSTTKLSLREKRASIYPYYAGFSLDFVAGVLRKLAVKRSSRILDPWNGTGTTTYAASRANADSLGIEINPALLSVARARVATGEQRDAAKAALRIALEAAPGGQDAKVSLAETYAAAMGRLPPNAGEPIVALLQCALFPVARSHFAGRRTKNPSWFTDRGSYPDVAASAEEIRNSAEGVFTRHALCELSNGKMPSFMLADTTRLPTIRRRFDMLVSSPPYLTRIDYVQATLPELAFLRSVGIDIPNNLRNKMLGTPLTGPVPESEIDELTAMAGVVLDRIARHSSKASGSYYHRFFARYFVDLGASIRGFQRLLSPGAQVCLVVQPSYYKEVFIDLPGILIEMCEKYDLTLDEIWDFDARNSMVSVNSRAHSEARRPPSESAIFFTNRRAK